MHHILLLPYYAPEEVLRYRRLAGLFARLPRPGADVRIVLAAARSTRPDAELATLFGQIAAVDVLQCRTGGTGYWDGSTPMFWEMMDYVAERDNGDGGFVLWLESDMVPVRGWEKVSGTVNRQPPKLFLDTFSSCPFSSCHPNSVRAGHGSNTDETRTEKRVRTIYWDDKDAAHCFGPLSLSQPKISLSCSCLERSSLVYGPPSVRSASYIPHRASSSYFLVEIVPLVVLR